MWRRWDYAIGKNLAHAHMCVNLVARSGPEQKPAVEDALSYRLLASNRA